MMCLDAEGLLGGEHVVSWQHEPRDLVLAVLQTGQSRVGFRISGPLLLACQLKGPRPSLIEI